jgi:hypothetical protein
MSSSTGIYRGTRVRYDTARHRADEVDQYNYQAQLSYVPVAEMSPPLLEAYGTVWDSVAAAGGRIEPAPDNDGVIHYAALAHQQPYGANSAVLAYERAVEAFYEQRQHLAELTWGAGVPPLPRYSAVGVAMLEVNGVVVPLIDPRTGRMYESDQLAAARETPFLGFGLHSAFEPLVDNQPSRVVIVDKDEAELFLYRFDGYLTYLGERTYAELPQYLARYMESDRAQYLLGIADPGELLRAKPQTQALFMNVMDTVGDAPLDQWRPDELARQSFGKYAGTRLELQDSGLTISTNGGLGLGLGLE